MKYQSLTTDDVMHDSANLLAEICLINKFGYIKPGAWRKNSEYNKEWQLLVQAIKRIVNTLNINIEQLAWYIAKFKITNIPFKDFGLLHYKIKQRFNTLSLDDLYKIYLLKRQSVPINNIYITKENTNTKTLLSILEELENE